MPAPTMHTHFFPTNSAEEGFGCICKYDDEKYVDEEGRNPYEQEAHWKRSRAMAREEEFSDMWEETEVREYKNGQPVYTTQYVHKKIPFEDVKKKQRDFAFKQRRWVSQQEERKYPQDDPKKKLYCIVEAIAPRPGFEERAEKLLQKEEKDLEEKYRQYLPQALVKTPPALGKLVVKSKDGRAVFDFYPSEDLKAWSIPELLEPNSHKVQLPAGERARAHMASVLEHQEHRAAVLYRQNLERCGYVLGRALTNEHIRPAYWSKEHVFWMPVDVVVDESASGPEIVAYRNFLRADKTLTQAVQAVLSQLNKGEENRLWSCGDADNTSNWSDIRILFLRYLRHHTMEWNIVLPEAPTPVPTGTIAAARRGLVKKVRECPLFSGTNILILTLVMMVLGLMAMLAYLILVKGARV